MKQNYSFIKLFMLTVMAFFAGNAMAEDVIWSEDFSSFADKDVLIRMFAKELPITMTEPLKAELVFMVQQTLQVEQPQNC